MFGENAMDCSAADAVRPRYQVGRGTKGHSQCDALLVRTHPKRF